MRVSSHILARQSFFPKAPPQGEAFEVRIPTAASRPQNDIAFFDMRKPALRLQRRFGGLLGLQGFVGRGISDRDPVHQEILNGKLGGDAQNPKEQVCGTPAHG